jgi:hypothetical protein
MKMFGAVVAVVGWMMLGAASALAVPPPNDDFANRETLTGSLPIEVSRSNVGATKEAGESIPGPPAPAGHSVWFEWEATSSGFVTIGACDDAFPTILGIFTGTELGHLTQVASGNADEGPACPYSGRQYTFDAVSGTKYIIAVDGNVFQPPEAPTPVTEGEIVLQIESTPTPPNDDFADASILEAPIGEEPGGVRYYFAHAAGFTWNATTEPGEPGAATSGASVWYTWTAPEDGTYRFGRPCCGTDLSLDLYSGDAVDELEPVLVGAQFGEVKVAAGTTLRIRVAGALDSKTEEATMANFDFNVSAELPPRPAEPPARAVDAPSTTPPAASPADQGCDAALKRVSTLKGLLRRAHRGRRANLKRKLTKARAAVGAVC